jgi:hypothetical protein
MKYLVLITASRRIEHSDITSVLAQMCDDGVPEEAINELRNNGKAKWEDRDEAGRVEFACEVMPVGG